MSVLDVWQQELRPLIPRGFLRRDQKGDSLFLSDFIRFPEAEKVAARIAEKGYTIQWPDGAGPARIDLTSQRYTAFLQSLPCPAPVPEDSTLYPWALAQRLIRANTPITMQNLPPACALIRLLHGGNAQALARLSALAAQGQRLRQPLPAAAGRLVLCMLAEGKGGSPFADHLSRTF